METTVHEIAEDVYRLSTLIPDAAPGGFTFNQYLITATEPLLFHCGPRMFFDAISEAVGRVMPVEQLRWISFGHVESDENGSMNQWLAAAPNAQVFFNPLGCMVQLNDLADRPPVPVESGDVVDIGHRIRVVATPHVPHAWEAQVLFDETTSTLLCGDLFSQAGAPPALVHDVDIVTPAMDAEDLFGFSSMNPAAPSTIRSLTELAPRTLALMHGPAFAGDCVRALDGLADAYAHRAAQTSAAVVG